MIRAWCSDLKSSAEHGPFFCLFDTNMLQLRGNFLTNVGSFVKVEVVVVTLSFWGAGGDETDLVVVTTGRAGRSCVDYCSFPSL